MSRLAGVRVVVTRAEHQAQGLVEAFAAAGAEVAVLPLLEVVAPANPRPAERAASELALYDWLVLTSTNAAAAFLPLTGGVLPARLKVAVVGDATARAVRAWDIEPTLQPARADAEGLLAELAPRVSRRQRVLLPHAADARPDLAQGLAAAGAEAVAVVAYDKRLPQDAGERATELFSRAPLGWVTFSSPSIVRHFVDVLGEAWPQRKGELLAASIGPVTSRELRRQAIEPAAEASGPTALALVAAVIAAL